MSDTCKLVVSDYYDSTGLQALQWTQVGFSVASILVVVYTLAFHLRKSWFEAVFKETLYTLYFFILWHSLLVIVIQAIHINARQNAKSPCEMQIIRKFCLIRIIMSFSFPSFACLHAAVTVQRVVTTFSGNRTLHHFIARCCLVLTILFCILYTSLGFHNYPLDGKTPYCAGYVKANADLLLIGAFCIMAMDIFNVIIGFLLMIYNRRKIRELTDSSLTVKFRYRQTLQSIQQMLPVAFFHLFCFTIQYLGFQIGLSLPLPEVQYVTLNGFIYMMPYYCFFCPAILLWVMILEERKKKYKLSRILKATAEAVVESHFSTIQRQWSSNRIAPNPREDVYRETRLDSE